MKNYSVIAFLLLLNVFSSAEDINLKKNYRHTYTHNNITIFSKDADEVKIYVDNIPRKENFIDMKEIVKNADSFLHDVFGKQFNPDIHGVCLKRIRSLVDQNFYWEWQVAYVDPESPPTSKSTSLIIVVVSTSGKVLMQKK
ncbi:MAG: hypothetical protein EAZ81_00035 [Verrucomicrobia bacterium]|jgi:hypothetical protein|nr:MAG: hypothetical protein EAZ81_00035 [Verrucomicrobiota bacterium]